jgi:hypothetical protein
MTRDALLPWPVYKEARALLFPWLACAFVVMVPAAVDTAFRGMSVAAYFLGAAALGALSIGQEYTDRTLSLLFSQPIGRARLFLNKLSVLAAVLVTLAVAGYALVFHHLPGSQAAKLTVTLLPVLYGLCIAPWLTMACRSPMAGTVFTLATPGILLLLGGLFGVPQYGGGPEMDAARIRLLWPASLVLCAVGAVMGWRMFMRLEAIESRGDDLNLPHWLRTTATTAARPLTKHHPLWLLVTKELRLQQMTLVVAALFLLGWLVATWLSPVFPDLVDVVNALTVFYVLLMGMLIGSFASADERRLGTLEWQVLLPIAMSKQWAVKVGVACGLAMLLAIGLPVVLAHLSPVIDAQPLVGRGLMAVVLLLTAGSLYVSTLCTSGLWALLASLPATIGAAMFASVALVPVRDASYTGWSWLFNVLAPYFVGRGNLVQRRVADVPDLLLIAGFITLVLRFALANHRSADRPAGRVWKQVILMAAFATAGVVLASGAAAVAAAGRVIWGP